MIIDVNPVSLNARVPIVTVLSPSSMVTEDKNVKLLNAL